MNNENTNDQTQTTTPYCDICGTQKTDSTETLKAEGWFLGSREHFCPNCND